MRSSTTCAVIIFAFAWSSLAATATAPTTTASIEVEYGRLFTRIKLFNDTCPEINPWIMDVEHCFLTYSKEDFSDLLRTEVIDFVRRPLALDVLFDRLLQPNLDDAEVLAIAEMLMFVGEHREKPDEKFVASRAADALKAAEDGFFRRTEQRYPKAPIREKIINAAKRVMNDTRTNETPTTRP